MSKMTGLSRAITSRKAGIAYNDIDALARHVEGFDAQHYFDQQGEVETHAAMQRWPLLARALGIGAETGPLSDPQQTMPKS